MTNYGNLFFGFSFLLWFIKNLASCLKASFLTSLQQKDEGDWGDDGEEPSVDLSGYV